MDKKYDNLRSKTIFDFTRDEKIIGRIFGWDEEWDEEWDEDWMSKYKENPELFVNKTYINESFERAIIWHMVLLACITDNKEFFEALKKEFQSENYMLFDFEWDD